PSVDLALMTAISTLRWNPARCALRRSRSPAYDGCISERRTRSPAAWNTAPGSSLTRPATTSRKSMVVSTSCAPLPCSGISLQICATEYPVQRSLEFFLGGLCRFQDLVALEEVQEAKPFDRRSYQDVGRPLGNHSPRHDVLHDLYGTEHELRTRRYRSAAVCGGAANDIDGDDDIGAVAKVIERQRIGDAAVDQD